MENKTCYIFGAGDLYTEHVDIRPGSLVIAADGGLYYTKKLGIEPDVFLGDFDSADRKDAGSNCVVFPSRKDYTDMFLAVEYGVERGYNHFELYGALGGKRIDHTLANLQMLSFYAKKGCLASFARQRHSHCRLHKRSERDGKVCCYNHLRQRMQGISFLVCCWRRSVRRYINRVKISDKRRGFDK